MLTDVHTHRVSPPTGRAIYNLRVTDAPVEIPDAVLTFSAGIHPWDAGYKVLPEAMDGLLRDPRCVAVGEIGLDRLTGPPLPQQQALFEGQMELACHFSKPVIIHSVRTQGEVIGTLRRFPKADRVMIHGFSQRAMTALRWLDEGCYLSYGASLVTGHRAVIASLKMTPLNRLFLESDDAVVPLELIYDAAANALKLPVRELSEMINHNYLTFFSNGKLA